MNKLWILVIMTMTITAAMAADRTIRARNITKEKAMAGGVDVNFGTVQRMKLTVIPNGGVFDSAEVEDNSPWTSWSANFSANNATYEGATKGANEKTYYPIFHGTYKSPQGQGGNGTRPPMVWALKGKYGNDIACDYQLIPPHCETDTNNIKQPEGYTLGDTIIKYEDVKYQPTSTPNDPKDKFINVQLNVVFEAMVMEGFKANGEPNIRSQKVSGCFTAAHLFTTQSLNPRGRYDFKAPAGMNSEEISRYYNISVIGKGLRCPKCHDSSVTKYRMTFIVPAIDFQNISTIKLANWQNFQALKRGNKLSDKAILAWQKHLEKALAHENHHKADYYYANLDSNDEDTSDYLNYFQNIKNIIGQFNACYCDFQVCEHNPNKQLNLTNIAKQTYKQVLYDCIEQEYQNYLEYSAEWDNEDAGKILQLKFADGSSVSDCPVLK